MRLLVVEDDQSFLDDLLPLLSGLPGSPEVEIAKSRDSALHLVRQYFFDLVVLDLKLPTVEGGLDLKVEHGFAVFAESQNIAPGTPIFILTGSSAEDIFPDLLGKAQQVDIWGEHVQRGTIDYLQKRRLDELTTKLMPLAEAICRVSDVEVQRLGRTFELTIAESRLIRIFVRRRGGARCDVSLLSGGLSGARVLRVKVFDATGAIRILAVAKVGTHTEIRDEVLRYDKEISRLNPNATPRRLEIAEFGGKDVAAAFYGLAGGYEKSLFQAAADNPQPSAQIVTQIEGLTHPWRDGVPERQMTIAEVRRRLLRDEELSLIVGKYGLNWIRDFESRAVQVRWCTVHGDLHGGNVLVNDAGIPILIDYGDVGLGAASLDPVTIELSMFFHPDGPLRTATWPNSDQASSWGDPDKYLSSDCPIHDLVRACRHWAGSVCAGQREIAASAYGYLVRQLKYSDVNVGRVLDLLNGVRAVVKAT
jgi:CheY-like chemotaxis protein